VWEAWKISKAFGVLPHVVYHIDNPIDAFAFDQAVYTFGSALQDALEAVEGKNKREIENKRLRVLEKYLGTSSSKKFADPGRRSD